MSTSKNDRIPKETTVLPMSRRHTKDGMFLRIVICGSDADGKAATELIQKLNEYKHEKSQLELLCDGNGIERRRMAERLPVVVKRIKELKESLDKLYNWKPSEASGNSSYGEEERYMEHRRALLYEAARARGL